MPLSAASADGSEAESLGDSALKVPATTSVAWARFAASHEAVAGYTHHAIPERGGGRMTSAATVPLVPLGHGWGGRRGRCGAPSHRTYGRRDGTELAETDPRVFRQRNAKD